MSNEGIQPGGIEIQYVKMTSLASGKTIDLKNVQVEFNLYEGIKQPFMSVDILLLDGLALTTRFPIIGNETIEMSFHTPVVGMEEKPIVKKFRVFAIENLTVDTQQRYASYILRCYDPEYFEDLTTLVKKSYGGVKISEMVKDVFETYLKGDPSKLKISNTTGTPTLVVPSMRPSETINKLFNRYAKSTEYEAVSNFMFYSSIDGYYFKTLEEMMDPSKRGYKPDKYYWTEKHLSDAENNAVVEAAKKPREWLKISGFEIVNKVNIEQSIRNGMYDNTVFYINPTVSEYGKKVFEYNYDFTKFQRVHKDDKPAAKTILEKSDLANKKGDSRQFLLNTNKGEYNESLDCEDPRYSFLGLQNASLAQLDNVTLNVTIPGDNTRKTGDIIEVVLPEFGATDDVIGEVDMYLSGFYLVVAVRHIYNTNSGYNTVMMCVKNCFEKPLE